MREAIHALKYGRLHPAAQRLGQMLANAIAQLATEAPADLLVIPVPLHRTKYSQRGFNQSRSLAAQAVQFLRKSHPHWRLTLAPSTLMRLRATGSQAGLTPRQRRLNVRGAFSVSDPSQVAAQHVLVVDDILTTGATARAAAQTLLKAGAASVWVATLARAQRSVPFGRHFDFASEENDAPPDNEGEYNEGPFGEAMHATDLGSDTSIELEQTSF
jgi:ComF family protein